MCSEPEEGLNGAPKPTLSPAPETGRRANVNARMRRTSWPALLGICLALAGCGGRTTVFIHEQPTTGVQSSTPKAAQQLGFPSVATKNTTRVAGADPVADAAGVALAVYPSAAAGTHPTAVTLAPTDDWQAAIASSVLMSSPIRAPILLSGFASLPSATKDALATLAPTGAGSIGGAQVIRIGDVPDAVRASGRRRSPAPIPTSSPRRSIASSARPPARPRATW